MFDQLPARRKRIAVVGGGISGMAAAYYLSAAHDVTVFEAESRLGGHARTVLAGRYGDQPVDTGFIVFNYVTYPYLTRLFRELDVPVEKSEMSFAVSIDDGALEFGLNSLSGLFAQKRNLARPKFYGMLLDILKFGREAEARAVDDRQTIGDLIKALELGPWFREHYLLPMCGAIWSTPSEVVDAIPAKALVRFFRNHALLAGTGKHQWWTVSGGSIEYVRRLEAALLSRGCTLRLGAPVLSVQRGIEAVAVKTAEATARFDEVIFACHSDQALACLADDATSIERDALGAIRYQPNEVVLHCDAGQMPKRRDCWASWVYRSQNRSVGVTYWMNSLQNIPNDDPLFITLNPNQPIDPAKIYDRVEFSHPLFDGASLKAQAILADIQGHNRTWFAGAYHRNGFHEDGIASAMRVVRRINATHEHRGIEGENSGYRSEEPVLEDL